MKTLGTRSQQTDLLRTCSRRGSHTTHLLCWGRGWGNFGRWLGGQWYRDQLCGTLDRGHTTHTHPLHYNLTDGQTVSTASLPLALRCMMFCHYIIFLHCPLVFMHFPTSSTHSLSLSSSYAMLLFPLPFFTSSCFFCFDFYISKHALHFLLVSLPHLMSSPLHTSFRV